MTENASKSPPPRSAYDLWQEAEGVPIHRGYYVEDLYTVEVGPWARFGASGALVNLALQTEDDAWVLEVPPGGQTNPVHHLFECQAYVLSGRGSASVWVEGPAHPEPVEEPALSLPKGRAGPLEPRTFEFGKGSLFALPLNASYQYFNSSGREPVRMFAVTSAPKMINLIRNPDFLFDNPYVFADRFDGRLDYFSDPGREIGKRTWKTNFVPDVRTFQLSDYSERGKGSTNVKFSLAGSAMAAHISEFKVGTYKMAHRHGAGAHVVILDGKGFSLMWEEGSEWMKVDWKDGSVLSPPDNWYHQHFNTGPTPARYLALRWNSPEYPSRSYWQPQYSENLGEQISLEDENPRIRQMWEADLARNGVQSRMEPVLSRAGR